MSRVATATVGRSVYFHVSVWVVCSIELEVNDPLLCKLGFSLTGLNRYPRRSPWTLNTPHFND